MRISFKNWLMRETNDIFGFQKTDNEKIEVQDDKPIKPINIELIMNELLKMPLNGIMPFSKFLNQIQWGENNGAIQMVISPLGSFKSIIRGMQVDLEGNQAWICKSILPYQDIPDANIQIDEDMAHMLFEIIEQTNQKQLESAIGNYSNLENLVVKLANETQRKKFMPEIFIFRGVKEIKHNEHYIIHFECRGQGVEAPGSGRLEMFAIEMTYNTKNGLIRSFGHDIQSPKKGHVWYPQPSEWDEYFSPAQPPSEIVNCICSALSTY